MLRLSRRRRWWRRRRIITVRHGQVWANTDTQSQPSRRTKRHEIYRVFLLVLFFCVLPGGLGLVSIGGRGTWGLSERNRVASRQRLTPTTHLVRPEAMAQAQPITIRLKPTETTTRRVRWDGG
jgi:hypothetical protein